LRRCGKADKMEKKSNVQEAAMKKQKIVIAGAGMIGPSLAQVYAQNGWQTVLLNRSEAGLERAKAAIEKDQEMLLRQGFIIGWVS